MMSKTIEIRMNRIKTNPVKNEAKKNPEIQKNKAITPINQN